MLVAQRKEKKSKSTNSSGKKRKTHDIDKTWNLAGEIKFLTVLYRSHKKLNICLVLFNLMTLSSSGTNEHESKRQIRFSKKYSVFLCWKPLNVDLEYWLQEIQMTVLVYIHCH